jgi:hypothetical protein
MSIRRFSPKLLLSPQPIKSSKLKWSSDSESPNRIPANSPNIVEQESDNDISPIIQIKFHCQKCNFETCRQFPGEKVFYGEMLGNFRRHVIEETGHRCMRVYEYSERTLHLGSYWYMIMWPSKWDE